MVGIDAVLTDDFDMQLDVNGDILTKDFFDTALLMSLYCERRATAAEMPDAARRRGWIGNESTPGFEIGSKLWLYRQSRLSKSTFRGLETVAENGLKWLVEDGYAVSVKAKVSFTNGIVALDIAIERPNSIIEKRFYELWSATG